MKFENKNKIINIEKWLAINKGGKVRIATNKPILQNDEILVKLGMLIPRELFEKPLIEATIRIQDILKTEFNPDVILNTKELIEEQTGVKIDFKVLPVKLEEEEDNEVDF